MEQTTEQFDSFALIEIMGHTKVAGKARTKTFGSTVMLQVDIPETKTHPAFTKMYGMSSIFSITPVTEELAQMHAEAYKVHPITEYAVQEAIRREVDRKVSKQVDERLRELNVHSEENRYDTEKHKQFLKDIEEILDYKGYSQIELDGDIIAPYYFEGRSPKYVADKLIEIYLD